MKRPYYNQNQRRILIEVPDSFSASSINAGLALLHVQRDIGEALPDWLHSVGRVVRKYRVTVLVFYALSIYMIYMGEYPSAAIAAMIGIYFSR